MVELIPLVAIVSLFVVLPAMILRHIERKRALEAQKHDGVSDELLQVAERMEKRIDALERILDVEVPGWREKHRVQ
ncbi:MAG TPA: envelope stress response membrane protein PspB [Solimonas sp.]